MVPRILFLVPPHNTFEYFTHPKEDVRQNRKADGKFYGNLPTDMPLGILSLSAYLKKFIDVEVDMIDFNIELTELDSFDYTSFYDYFLDFLYRHEKDKGQYDYVGITTLFTPSFFSLIDLSKISRKLFPEAMIIGGGSVPTTVYDTIFKYDEGSFDVLCFGEGEKPLLELLRASDKKAYIDSCPTWITREKAVNNESFEHDFIEDLDEIPFMDYGLCNMRRYGINPAISAYAPADTSKNNFHIMTSRGCPFKCTFCSSHKVHGRSMRYFSLERVKEDFDRLKREFSCTSLIFQDDHLMGDKKRAQEIIEYVGEIGLTAIFQNGLAVYALTREMLQAIKNANCHHLVLPVESGSDRVLKRVMRKPLKLSIVNRVAKDCRELGIYMSVNILIGMPGETKQDIQDAMDFLKTVGANWFIILIASPLVGSEMYEICETNDYLLESNIVGSDYKKGIVETEDFTAEYIQDMMYRMNIELNFIENHDFKNGNYDIALRSFENVIRAKSDHAMAYYFAALCCEKLGLDDKYADYREKALEYGNTEFWKNYFEMYGLETVLLQKAV